MNFVLQNKIYTEPMNYDHNKWLIILTGFPLSGLHCAYSATKGNSNWFIRKVIVEHVAAC